MKKFWIAIIVILAILAGGVTYALVANKGAMLTVFSQDQEKIQKDLQRTFEKIADKDQMAYKFYIDMKDGEDELSVEMSMHLKLVTDTTINAIIEYKLKAKTEGVESTQNVKAYFKDNTVYTKVDDGLIINQGTFSFSEMLGELGFFFGGESILMLDGTGMFSEFPEFKSTIKISFNPFYVGQLYTSEENDMEMYFGINTLGQLKEIGMNGKLMDQPISIRIVYLYNNVSLNFPELPA